MYDINVIPLNAVPVAKMQISNFIYDDEKEIIKSITEWDPREENSNEPFISKTYNLFEDYNLPNLKKRFDECVKQYSSNVLGSNIEFKNVGSWITKNIKGTKHYAHIHYNVALSVVTYFDDAFAEDSELPGIVFTTDGLDNTFKRFVVNDDEKIITPNVFNKKIHIIKPKKNTVIIFPGHLIHHSQISTTDSRYCVGANYFFHGSFGSSRKKNYVEIY